MADREFKIKITTEADTAAARQESDALKEVGKSGTDANKSIAEETEKLTVKKGELRAAVRGLHHEFPELGRLAHLALHPIGLAVAGLVGSFAIWQNRVESMAKALAGVELPDNAAFDPKHISGAAEAWGEFNVKLEETFQKLNSADEKAKTTLANIESALKRQKELLSLMHAADLASIDAQGGEAGMTVAAKRAAIEAKIKLENDADQARLRAKEDQALDLMQGAVKKEHEAGKITVASSSDDADTLGKYKANAEAAEKAIKESSDWLSKIGALKDNPLSALAHPIETYKMYARYGTMSGSEAMALERENIQRSQLTVDSYQDRLARSQSRDDLRKRRAGLYGEASSDEAKGEDIYFNQLPKNYAEAAADSRARKLGGLYQQQSMLLQELEVLDKMASDMAKHGGVTKNVGAIIMQFSRELDAIKHQIRQGRPT